MVLFLDAHRNGPRANGKLANNLAGTDERNG